MGAPIASFPGLSSPFNWDGEKRDLIHIVCTCAELRANRSCRARCNLRVLLQGGEYCFILFSKHQEK